MHGTALATACIRRCRGGVPAKRILASSGASCSLLDVKILDVPGSGSVANNTRSRNQFGQYVRNRTSPTQSTSAEAIAARAGMTAAVALWQSLTDAQRMAWEDYAQQFRGQTRLGIPAPLSGFDAAVQCNLVGAQMAVPVVFSDPPPLPNFVESSMYVTWTGTAFGGPILWHSTPNSPSGNQLFIYACKAGSSGWMRPTSGGRRLLINRVNFGFTPNNQATPYFGRFGPTPPSAGEVSFWGLREVSNGRLGPESVSRLVVP